MITGKTLHELALEVERQSNAQHDLIVPSGQMEMRAHSGLAPALAVKGESDLFPLTETGLEQINFENIHFQSCHSAEKCDFQQNLRRVAARCTLVQR